MRWRAPGSRGWVGERCLADADCTGGTTCAGEGAGKPGVCTVACAGACADQPGFAMTTCIASSPLGASVTTVAVRGIGREPPTDAVARTLADALASFGTTALVASETVDGRFGAGTAAGWLRARPRFRASERWISGSMYIGLGVAATFAGHARK